MRRGYFVEGLGGAQFALPGALDRLRAGEAAGVVTLAAADPANPYGAALPWPDHPAGRPSRSAGAQVILLAGRLRRLRRTGRPQPARLLRRRRRPGGGGRGPRRPGSAPSPRVLRPRWTAHRSRASPLAAALAAAGFVPSYRGMVLRRP